MDEPNRKEWDSVEDIPDERLENMDNHEKAIQWDVLPPEDHPFVVSLSFAHKEDGIAAGAKLTAEQLALLHRTSGRHLDHLEEQGFEVSITEHVVGADDEAAETPGFQ